MISTQIRRSRSVERSLAPLNSYDGGVEKALRSTLLQAEVDPSHLLYRRNRYVGALDPLSIE
jgi:hypothetical protein